jgi:flavorubredoxin
MPSDRSLLSLLSATEGLSPRCKRVSSAPTQDVGMEATTLRTGRLPPTEIATDTFLVHAHCSDQSGLVIPVNTMVIRAARPVVIDTGMPAHRRQFLDDVFALVDPARIGWVFLSHADVDHVGNLGALLGRATQAILLVDRALATPLARRFGLAHHRVQPVHDGERVDVGDRTLTVVGPPVYDAIETHGLFDPTTGVYWSADSFGTLLRRPVSTVDRLHRGDWQEGIAAFDHYTAPWLATVDGRAHQRSVDTIEGLGASVIAGAHTPAIVGHHVHQAITATRRSPTAPVPDDDRLEQIRTLLGG